MSVPVKAILMVTRDELAALITGMKMKQGQEPHASDQQLLDRLTKAADQLPADWVTR